MSTHDEHLMNLQDGLLQIKDSELYTGDYSTDINGKPSLKSKTGNWKACYFILGTECFERLAFGCIAGNLVTYLTTKMHLGNASAARMASAWIGTCFLTPLIGAFLADSYWGRYRMISVFSIVYIIGVCGLTISASVPAFKPAECVGSVCPSATPAQYAIFFVGLYLIAAGTGGIKSCIPVFGADQFDDTDTHERIKKGSFFNWYYFSLSAGSVVSTSLLVWIQENVGWGIGYGISVLCIVVAFASFISGTPFYRLQKPGVSPLTRICQVIAASIWKSKLDPPQDTCLLYEESDTSSHKLEHTEGLEFLDKAAVVSTPEMRRGDLSNRWRLCTVTQVEELKILIRLFPTWAAGIVDFAAHAQASTTFIEQGMVMERRVGSFTIPAATLATCAMICSLVLIPIYEKTFVSLARKFTGKEKGFSELQRIGIGLCLTILAMVFATLVETRRLRIVKELYLVDENVAAPLSILWQVPQYAILGIANVFSFAGRLEFVYDQSPESMRCLGSAFTLLLVTMGSYMNSLVLTMVTLITTAGGEPGWIPDNLNNGHMDNYFAFWAGLTFLNLLVYITCAMKYKPKGMKNVM